MHHRCMYVCVCMHVCRSLNIVLSKEVWKSSFDVSFLMRWSVPCVNTCNWPSTLRTVTGELLVVWTRGSAPAFVRLHWQSKRPREQMRPVQGRVLCWEASHGAVHMFASAFTPDGGAWTSLLPRSCWREVLVWDYFSTACMKWLLIHTILQNFCCAAWLLG